VSRGGPRTLGALEKLVTQCELCPRLRAHCRTVAHVKRRAYRDQTYWGRPVPGFGDPKARLLLVGLAPGAHGSNRTGRMFTGDASGDFLYAALHRAGLASTPVSRARGDGLTLRDCYISAVARCAPPGNRPTPAEIATCRPFLLRELALLTELRVILALGGIAWAGVRELLRDRGGAVAPQPKFGHSVSWRPGPDLPFVVASYHPSQQNTQTGRLTAAMFDAALEAAIAATGR
jgi:uracil-DNA glycosylase family 4